MQLAQAINLLVSNGGRPLNQVPLPGRGRLSASYNHFQPNREP